MSDWLDRVAEKVAHLRERSGASHHCFTPLPPSRLAEVVACEAALGIRLTEDYRRYITEFANGGIGPANGLLRFGHAETWETIPYVTGCRQHWEFWRTTIRNRPNAEALGRPFPFTESIFLYPRPYNEIEAWHREHFDHCGDGLLTLADYGCGMYAVLVVSGPAHGEVWMFDLCNDGGIWRAGEETPSTSEAEGVLVKPPVLVPWPPAPWSFAVWYEHWLDEVLASSNSIIEEVPHDAEILQWIAGNLPEDALSMSPEEFVARYAHRRFLVENCRWSRCVDPELECWIRRFKELIWDPTAVERCREDYLPPEECDRLRELEMKDVQECFRPVLRSPIVMPDDSDVPF